MYMFVCITYNGIMFTYYFPLKCFYVEIAFYAKHFNCTVLFDRRSIYSILL